MPPDNIELPEWCWHTELECVVRIMKTGHFPNTALVQLPDDRIVEIEIQHLEWRK
jgi:hypothetical protein